jgi:hypothetical protein
MRCLAPLRSAVIVAALLLPSLTFAQDIQLPTIRDARGTAERDAFNRAKCVFEAVTTAGNTLTVPLQDLSKPEMRDRITAELEKFELLSREGVKACLSEQEVYELGRYSFLEDLAFAVGSSCRLTKAPAARFERTPNNNDGDIVNGAVRWQKITDTSLQAHPFFRGQAEARQDFSTNKPRICEAILEEYGPNGSRFPGLVRARR